MLYTDRMAIYRHTSGSADTDGTTPISTGATPVKSSILCRISFPSSDAASNFTEESNPTRLTVVIFCDPSEDIHVGDLLVVDRIDDSGVTMTSYRGIANLPNKFVTHQEIELTKVGDA